MYLIKRTDCEFSVYWSERIGMWTRQDCTQFLTEEMATVRQAQLVAPCKVVSVQNEQELFFYGRKA